MGGNSSVSSLSSLCSALWICLRSVPSSSQSVTWVLTCLLASFSTLLAWQLGLDLCIFKFPLVLLDFRDSPFFLSSGQKLGSLVTLFIVFGHFPGDSVWILAHAKGRKWWAGERKTERASVRTCLILLNCSSTYQRGGWPL